MFFESHVSCMCWLLSQHQQLDGEPVSDLQAFIMQCKDPPESGCFSENETRGRCLMCCLHRWTHTRHVSIRDDQRWCEELQKEWLTCQSLLLYLFWTSLKLFWLVRRVWETENVILCVCDAGYAALMTTQTDLHLECVIVDWKWKYLYIKCK